jgi:hypothetical protein
MKTIRVVLTALLLTSGMMACKKESTGISKNIEGAYLGKWGDVGGPVHSFFKLQLKSNGKLVRLNEAGEVTANGFYTLSGINFEGSYTHTSNGEKHSVAGLYTDFDGVIVGTWGYGSSKANGGIFELKKQ